MGTRLSEAEATMNSLIQKGVRKLVLDLTHVEFVDSAGLGLIMHIFGEMQEAGGRFRVAGATDQAKRLFELTHTTMILAIDPDVETSVRALQDKSVSAGEA